LAVVDGGLVWPMTTSLGWYLAVVEDVATRYTGLPLEHVLRALRRELRGLDDEELIQSIGQRISSGQQPWE